MRVRVAGKFDRVPLWVGQIEDWLRRFASDDQVIAAAEILNCDPDYRSIMRVLHQLETAGKPALIRAVLRLTKD